MNISRHEMQFRKFFLHLFSSLPAFLFLVSGATAQEIRTNEKDEKIVVYPDGSWQYFVDYLRGGGPVYGPEEGKETDNRYPVFEGRVAPMEHPAYSLTEEDARKIAIRQSQLAGEAVLIAENRAREASLEREKLEEELEQARRRTDADAPTLRQLQTRLDLARRIETETGREAQLARREALRAEELIQKGDYLEELVSDQLPEAEASRRPAGTERLSSDFFTSIIGLDNRLDGSPAPLRTPPSRCTYTHDGRDEYTGQHRRDLQKELLFTHTDERLRLYLKDKEYMRCEAYMSSLAGGFRFLTLEFTFAYPNAREAYGFIEKGSFLMVKLLNGDFITLRSGKMDRGRWDTEKELLTYSVNYPIDRSQISILRRSEVDSILVFWSSGYEEYEVFEVGFFMNQLNCLEN